VGYRKVVFFNVTPNVGETMGSIFLDALIALVIKPYYHQTLEYKRDFRCMALMKDGVEVLPSELARIPRLSWIPTYMTEAKDFPYQGIYAHRPRSSHHRRTALLLSTTWLLATERIRMI
jgi:hypothetical protein